MKYRVILLSLIVATTAIGAANAAVLRVEQDGTGGYLKIQDAVNVAASGDTIMIGPGRYDDLQPRGVNNVVCVAYWEDNRNLTFIGESADEVIIGPATYAPSGTGPQGIHQHEPADVVVRSMSFTNLRAAVVVGRGTVLIDGVRFDTGESGLAVQVADTCVVRNSSFTDYPAVPGDNGQAIIFNGAEFAEIVECEFIDSYVYFGSTRNGILRDCISSHDKFAGYASSGGLIQGCVASGYVFVYNRDPMRIEGNTLTSPSFNLRVDRQETRVIVERNIITSPTSVGNFQIADNTGSFAARENDIRAGAGYAVLVFSGGVQGAVRHLDMGDNYWFENSNAAALDSLIYDANDDSTVLAVVDYEPIRTESVPVKKRSLGGLKALFLGR